jgi:dTDP-4-dehydrorhamnose 3,5-epimerase-like enzyme
MELVYITSREYNRISPEPPSGEEGRIRHDDPNIGYEWEAHSPIP